MTTFLPITIWQHAPTFRDSEPRNLPCTGIGVRIVFDQLASRIEILYADGHGVCFERVCSTLLVRRATFLFSFLIHLPIIRIARKYVATWHVVKNGPRMTFGSIAIG